MLIHVLQHEPAVAPGFIVTWAEKTNNILSFIRTWADDPWPEPDKVHLLIILGGTMNIDEENKHPWLRGEKAFLKKIASNATPVLGICLGAQLLADALGAQVYRNTHTEIGWHAVNFNQVALTIMHIKGFPVTMPLFHWHSYCFDLPQGAVSLGSSLATPVQGFVYNKCLVALQFHPEVTPAIIEDYMQDSSELLQSGEKFIQNEITIRLQYQQLSHLHQLLGKILNYLVSLSLKHS